MAEDQENADQQSSLAAAKSANGVSGRAGTALKYALKQIGDKESSAPEETVQSDKDYVAVIKKIKKENITTSNIGEIMLCQIPGVSAVTSLAIMEKYKNLPNLIKEIETNKTCLDNISYINSKGQSRKLTKPSIANVVKFLQN